MCLHGAGNLKTEKSFGLTARGEAEAQTAGTGRGGERAFGDWAIRADYLCTRWALCSDELV